ncbi:reverse transcriptase domain-containing protein [Tanacetum coccineum]|uniref:Reverse transcriptase domain-containing protein n=1 Tax=Tanacetum coccineum TaxID=301880 RepID=A0ABQ5ENB5_9ASTR
MGNPPATSSNSFVEDAIDATLAWSVLMFLLISEKTLSNAVNKDLGVDHLPTDWTHYDGDLSNRMYAYGDTMKIKSYAQEKVKEDVGLGAGLEAVEKKLEKDGTYSSREQGEADWQLASETDLQDFHYTIFEHKWAGIQGYYTWPLALPCYGIVTVATIFMVYISLNFMETPSPTSLNSICSFGYIKEQSMLFVNMSFVTMADEITLESLTEEQFECFIEYYHENYPEDFKSDLENLEEIYKMMNGGDQLLLVRPYINYFHHFLDILENYNLMDDEPMWVADRVVAPTPGSAITILETANEFAIKEYAICLEYRDTENEVVRLMMFPLSLTGEAKTWLNELNEGTIKTWDELQTAFISRFFPPALFDRLLREIPAFSQHENETLTEAWLRMKEMLSNCHGHNLSKGNIIKIFYHGLNEITQEVLNAVVGGIFLYKTPNQAYQLLEDKVLLKLNWAKNQKSKPSLKKTIAFTDKGSSNSNTDKITARMDAMTMKIDA